MAGQDRERAQLAPSQKERRPIDRHSRRAGSRAERRNRLFRCRHAGVHPTGRGGNRDALGVGRVECRRPVGRQLWPGDGRVQRLRGGAHGYGGADQGRPAIDIAADAVANWRIRKLAAGGLQGVEAEGQFALLCWDTLRAAEFRFNEAKLLGNAVGMDVSALEIAGLISVKQDQVKLLSAAERRRDVPLRDDEAQQLLFGFVPGAGKRVKRADALKIHPRDPAFRTHLDKAHALALAYADADGGVAGIGAAKSFALKHSIKAGDATMRLIEALLKAAPPAVRRNKGEVAAKFAEFRAWHAMLQPLFGIEPPDWTEKPPDQGILQLLARAGDGFDDEADSDLEEDEEEAESEDDAEPDE